MKKYQYMRIALKYFTKEIRDEYNIEHIADNGYVCVETRKGMYRLKEAIILTFNNVVQNLAPFEYHPAKYTAGLWKHERRKIDFTLYVDDFGIKYHNKEDAEHFLNILSTNYEISTDWTGQDYIELTIDWNYPNKYMDISMP